ncbi:MAG: F0F1 ATP synthase subunit A, partial [Bacteroidia bacterium]|nr:F0F1 ATP synthase subunit A [Bacteroidia bacterium]
GKFSPGDMIMHHIADAYELHYFTTGKGTDHEHHYSVPLPIILFSPDKGLDIFLSSKFKNPDTHEAQEYNGYVMDHGHIEAVDGSSVYDFSITKNVVGIFLSMIILFWVFISVAKTYTRRKGQAPKGLQSFIEPIIIFVRDDIAKACIGEKNYGKYMPFLLTIFFFIWLNNLMGLIPIAPFGANVTGNIAVTLVLAIFTFVITTVSGNKNYWKHIVAMPGVPLPVLFIITPIEIIGMFLKPFVLMVRLFANVTAGHIIILSLFSLIFIFGAQSTGGGFGVGVVSTLFVIFMSLLELLVAFIQAYVFTLLSAIYFAMATEEAHH